MPAFSKTVAKTPFAALTEAASKLRLTYHPVQFPMVYDAETNKFGFRNSTNTLWFQMTKVGKTYLLHTIGADKYKGEFSDWKIAPETFTNEVNEFVAKTRISLQATAILSRGALYGIPQKYNIVGHDTVLEFIEDMGLSARVIGGDCQPYAMTVHIKSPKAENPKFTYGITVNNGMTGHVSLNFTAFIKIGEQYLLDIPTEKVVKHQSKIGEWYNQMQAVSNEVVLTEVEDTLKGMGKYATIELLQGYDYPEGEEIKWLSFMDSLKRSTADNGLDLLYTMSHHIVYGQKPLIRGAMDFVIKSVAAYLFA